MIFGARKLAERRLALVERSGGLRRALIAGISPVAEKAAAADRLIAAARTVVPWIVRAVALYGLLKRRSPR